MEICLNDPMENLKADMGKRIKQIREGCKMTLVEFSAEFGFGKTAAHQWETGTTTPTIETLVRLAKKGNVTLDWLITGDNPKPPPAPLDNGDALAIAITTRPEVLGKIKQRIREEIREELSEYQANPRDRLTDDEKTLIDNYRAADDRTKENALWILQRSAQESRTHDGGGSDCADTRSA